MYEELIEKLRHRGIEYNGIAVLMKPPKRLRS